MSNKSRIQDLAALLPWIGLFLFTPPVLLLFRPEVTIGGVPLLPVYLFVAWFALILASRHLTHHLSREDSASSDDAPKDRP